jgi:hypothetical protein
VPTCPQAVGSVVDSRETDIVGDEEIPELQRRRAPFCATIASSLIERIVEVDDDGPAPAAMGETPAEDDVPGALQDLVRVPRRRAVKLFRGSPSANALTLARIRPRPHR